MGKRTKSDSVSAQLQTMVNVMAPELEPPSHVRLPPESRQFWSGIMVSRARDEWSKNDLVIAAQLARCQYDIERESMLLDGEGSVLENARGTPVMNPRHSVLEQLARRELALMRSLAMTASLSNNKDRAKLDAARDAERSAAKTKDELLDEDLIAL